MRRVVSKQRTHAARAHIVGKPRAGGLSQVNEGHALLAGDSSHMAHLLGISSAGRCAGNGEVIDNNGDVAAIDLAEADNLTVTWGLLLVFLEHAGSTQ